MAEVERHDEEKRKVVLTQEDVRNIEEFFTHFKIDMLPGLKTWLEQFKANPAAFTFEDQRALRAQLAGSIVTSTHPLLTDAVFNNIRELCGKAYFDAEFQREFEEEVSKK